MGFQLIRVSVLLISLILSKVTVNGSFNYDDARPFSAKQDTRMRKEFTAMSFNERRRFIEAYKLVSSTEPFRRRYEHLVGLHQSLFSKVHVEKQFFPWHRWYLLEFENLLQQVDSRVTLPYWDWSLNSQRLWTAGKKDVWNNYPWGLGGNGSSPFGCVEKGPFNKRRWRLAQKSGGGCLRRNFMGRMPSVVSIHATLRHAPRQFKKFENEIRLFYHNELHCCIQGTMELPSASNTPEFVLHHTFMDKIWYDWQAKGHEYKFKLEDNMNSRLLGSRYKVGQFMNSFNLLDGTKVVYRDPFPGYKHLHHTLKSLHLNALKMLDSYNPNVKKSCCPTTTKGIERKIKEIEQSLEDVPLETEIDYGSPALNQDILVI